MEYNQNIFDFIWACPGLTDHVNKKISCSFPLFLHFYIHAKNQNDSSIPLEILLIKQTCIWKHSDSWTPFIKRSHKYFLNSPRVIYIPTHVLPTNSYNGYNLSQNNGKRHRWVSYLKKFQWCVRPLRLNNLPIFATYLYLKPKPLLEAKN